MHSKLVRWGGLAAILGGLMYLAQSAISQVAPQPRTFVSFSDYLIEAAFIIALLSTLAGIVGLHALQRDRYGRLGIASSLVAFIGFAMLLVSAVSAFLAGHLGGFLLPALGFLLVLVGLVILGIATLRAGVLPRLYGAALIIAAPAAFVLESSLVSKCCETYGATIALGILWLLIGYAIASTENATSQQTSRVA